MQLKNLEIYGFKSFADKTNIDFGDGITCIVGPNGSGKSNISDAIRWVLGEQSAKSLRGGNMQDVIFAGTQKRKALGFAEVSLTIDNSEKKLPIDFDEVIITRRVYRSGESEYYINKSSARLKDVHQLFMDTGVGRDGYSIIGQGKIEEIIRAKSEDRRLIFEEAAGITKFRYRKEEAERKLFQTNENIMRVSDIITELENQIEPLKNQSEKAKKFLSFRDELKALDVNVALYNIEKYKTALAQVDEVYDMTNNQLQDVIKEAESIEQQVKNMFSVISDNEEMLEKMRDNQQSTTQELTEYQSDITLLKSKIDYNLDSVKRIRQEIIEFGVKSDELEKSLCDKDDNSELLQNQFDDLNKKIERLNIDLTELEKISDNQNSLSEEATIKLSEKINLITSLRSKISSYEALTENFELRMNTIASEISQKKGYYDELQGNAKNLQEQLDKNNNDIEKSKSEIEVLTAKHIESAEKCRKNQQGINDEQNLLKQTSARQKMLQDMEDSFDNYSRSVKAVMQAHKTGSLKSLKLYGTVAKIISVPEDFVTAIEVSLGAAAQNIITETENDAKGAIEYLKQTKQGRATFLPISAARGNLLGEEGLSACPGYLGIASELVNSEDYIKGVVRSLLGRVVVVDNIDNAIAISKKYNYKFRVVTLDGELLSPGGSMSGGSKNNTSGFFFRANELAQLKKQAVDLEASFKDKSALQISLLKDVDALQVDLEGRKSNVRILQDNAIKLDVEVKHLKGLLVTNFELLSALNSESGQLSDKIGNMQAEIKQYNNAVEEAQQETAILEKDLESVRSSTLSLHSKKENVKAELAELKMQQSLIIKDIELHNERVDMVNLRKNEISQSIESKNQNIQEILETNDDLQDDIEFKNQQIEDKKQELENIKAEIASADKIRQNAQQSIKQKQDELKKVMETQISLQQEVGRIESKKTKSEVELENVINRLWEDYELTITTAQEIKTEIENISAAQKKINQLKEQIKSLGNINIDAIEEYKTVKERFEFLTVQRKDLTDAQANLQAVISDMVEIMKAEFSEKFKIINQHFNEVFVELFGGGKASLKLTEPNDILSSGVEIDVQPPGKAVKNMLQLSGGEQAFVSIALLFAILKVRPSPFCVLDEIEAALDDVNVFRFSDYLKNFCGSSQFIVVTHRRGTMEVANTLYGVTMQEQGVTKLISINIDEIMQMNA